MYACNEHEHKQRNEQGTVPNSNMRLAVLPLGAVPPAVERSPRARSERTSEQHDDDEQEPNHSTMTKTSWHLAFCSKPS